MRQFVENSTRIIQMGDDMYYVKGQQSVQAIETQGGVEYWKKCWNVIHVLRNGNTFYFCDPIIIAEYETIHRQ
jgi:hypothetical protein